MHGDYDDLSFSDLGRWRWPDLIPPVRYVVAAVVVLAAACVALAGRARGAEPPTFAVVNRVPPAFTVVNRVPARPALKTVRWQWWDAHGNTWFTDEPVPPQVMPAPGVSAPRPFAPTPATTRPTVVPSVVGPNTSSPAPAPSRGVTGTFARPVIRGGTDGCPT